MRRQWTRSKIRNVCCEAWNRLYFSICPSDTFYIINVLIGSLFDNSQISLSYSDSTNKIKGHNKCASWSTWHVPCLTIHSNWICRNNFLPSDDLHNNIQSTMETRHSHEGTKYFAPAAKINTTYIDIHYIYLIFYNHISLKYVSWKITIWLSIWHPDWKSY